MQLFNSKMLLQQNKIKVKYLKFLLETQLNFINDKLKKN